MGGSLGEWVKAVSRRIGVRGIRLGIGGGRERGGRSGRSWEAGDRGGGDRVQKLVIYINGITFILISRPSVEVNASSGWTKIYSVCSR